MPELSPIALAWAATVLFVAGFVRGYSGFGFSAVTVTGLVLVTSPAVAVSVAILLEVAASLVQARSVWRDIDWRGALVLLAGGLVGNPVGVAVLAVTPADALKAGVYLSVLAVAALLAFARPRPRTLSVAAWLAVGLAAGVVNGATALSGLFIVTVMTLTATPPLRMRATLVAYFFLSDLYATGLLASHGLVDADLLRSLLVALPVVALGIWIGSRRFLATSDAQFRRATLVLLSALALAGLAQLAASAAADLSAPLRTPSAATARTAPSRPARPTAGRPRSGRPRAGGRRALRG